MKKFYAILLTLAILLSLAACGGEEKKSDGGSNTKTPSADLQTMEMEIEASGLEELTKVTIGAPKSMRIEENDWNIVFTDEKQDVQVEAYLLCDYDCYAINQEYAKDEYEGYGEQKFGDFDGYYYISESGYYVEVFVYLGCVAEMDDVYLSFSISALEGETDPMELFKLADVQTILSSAAFYPAQEEAA